MPCSDLALALTMVGRKAEACRLLEFELQSNRPENRDFELLANADPKEALAFFKHLAVQFPSLGRPWAWKARLLLNVGRPYEAKQAARKAHELDPDDMESWGASDRFMATSLLAQLHRPKVAQRNVSEAAEFCRQGERFDSLHLRKAAAGKYRKALDLMPNDFVARIRMGSDLVLSGEAVAGEKEVRAACAQVPMRLASIKPYFVDLGIEPAAWGIARRCLEDQIRKGTKNPGVFALVGYIESSLHDSERAAQCFYRAIKLDPDNAFSWGELLKLPRSRTLSAFRSALAHSSRVTGDLSPVYTSFDFSSLDIPDIGALRRAQLEVVRRRWPVPLPILKLRANLGRYRASTGHPYLPYWTIPRLEEDSIFSSFLLLLNSLSK